MSSPADPDFADAYGAAWSTPDPGPLLAFFSEDAVYEDVGTGVAARGHAEIARFLGHMLAFAPDSRIVFDAPAGPPARFALPWTWSGTASGALLLDGRLHAPTGRTFSVDGIAWCAAGADGRLTAHRDVYDMHAVVRELGLLDAPTGDAITGLVRAVYEALATGDRDALAAALDPAFVAHFAEGMPAGGGRAEGADAAIASWWEIGRAFAVRAEPQELVPCADGRLLVRGRYRGRARAGGDDVDAEFVHLWTAAGGVLTKLRQVTDTARW